jgi:hypothetical protein
MSEISTVSAADLMTRPDRRWVLTLASICGVILAYGVFMSTNKIDRVAYLVGYNAFFGLIILLVFRAISGRKTTPQLGAYAYVAILSALVAASLIGAARQNAPMKRSAARLSQGVSSIVDSGVDAHGNPKIIDTVLDTKKIESGEAGEIERFTKTYLNREVALRNDYFRGLQAIGFPDIMDPNRIAKDAGLVQSFEMLDKADSLLQALKEKVHALQASTREEINTLAVEDSAKPNMRKSFDKGLSLSPAEAEFDIEARCLTESRAIFQLLKDTQGQWSVNRGKFYFQREQDLAAFQAHAEVIDKTMEQGRALEQASNTAAQSTIKGADSP